MPESVPLISVVIPSYNRENSIRFCVESVLQQTMTDLEVIVVDDCSRDRTVAVLETIADPRLRVIRHEVNKGAPAARNTGIAVARADWIAFQDSDDEWLPTKLEKQLERLRQAETAEHEPWIGAFCRMQIFDEQDPRTDADGIPACRYYPDAVPPEIESDLAQLSLQKSYISTQTLLVRKDILNKAGGFDEDMPALQDWDLVLRLAPLGRIAFVEEPLVIQHLSANSITRSQVKRVRAREQIYAKIRPRLTEEPRAHATYLYIMAGEWRLIGDYAKAQHYLYTALRLNPTLWRSWLALVYCIVAGRFRSTAPMALRNSSD